MDAPKSLCCWLWIWAPSACLAALAVTRIPPALASGQSDAFAEGLLALKQNRFDFALQQLTVAEEQQPSTLAFGTSRGIALAGLGRSVVCSVSLRRLRRPRGHVRTGPFLIKRSSTVEILCKSLLLMKFPPRLGIWNEKSRFRKVAAGGYRSWVTPSGDLTVNSGAECRHRKTRH